MIRVCRRHWSLLTVPGLAALVVSCAPLASPRAPVTEKPASPATVAGSAPSVQQSSPSITGTTPVSAATPARATTAATASGLGEPFSTRYARFQPVAFDAIPGWNSDNLRASLKVFRSSCGVLSHKRAWRGTCAALARTRITSETQARQFFEDHFHAYQVINLNHTQYGLITGYFEPELAGSRTRVGRFRYPVYGLPRDLYELDSRVLSGARKQWFRIDGRRLRAAAPHTPGARLYEIALGSNPPDLADKRYRVRVTGDRIVSYWSRQEIDKQGLDAPVLAWVDDAWALYSMQIQGSGRIRLRDGSMLRLAYAGQNGWPFLPHVSNEDRALLASAITTRGLHLAGADTAARDDAAAGGQSVAEIIATLGGGGTSGGERPDTGASNHPARPIPKPAATAKRAHDPQVQSMIAQLLGKPATPAARMSQPTAAPAAHAETSPGVHTTGNAQVQQMVATLQGRATPQTAGNPVAAEIGTPVDSRATGSASGNYGNAGGSTGIHDPSFVFFRRIDSDASGPPGALGVPLTAGRSLAVDPRTTPLGAPVFIDTEAPASDGQLERLMLAQDTGGAIRGSVRGDFFWGFGQDAGAMAAATNADGRMWLLLPKSLALGALSPKVRTRGLGTELVDCVIPDGVSCVEN